MKNKKKKTEPVTKSAQEAITEAVTASVNERDMFGRKIKRVTPVLLLDDYLLKWRRQLMQYSRNRFLLYTGIIALLTLISVFILPAIAAVILVGIAAVLIIGLYLLLDIKLQYITGLSNSLQIPTFTKLTKIIKESMSDGYKDLTEVTQQLNYKPYQPFILMYMSRNDTSLRLEDFLAMTKSLPQSLKHQVARTQQNKFTPLANMLYPTAKIKAVRPKRSADEIAYDETKGSMVGVSLSEISRDGVKKRGGRAKSVQEAISQLELMKESKTFVKGERFKETAPWYMKLFTVEQLDAMLEMNMTPRQMSRWQIQRIQKSLILPIMALIVVVAAMFLKGLFPVLAVAANPLYILAGLLVGFVMYQFQARTIKSSLKAWRFKRSMAFAQMVQIIVPYLFLMKAHGGSLIEVFNNVANRLEDQNDKALVVQLIKQIRSNPNSDAPFINFAHAFTSDPSSVIFMTAVNRAAQNNSDTSVLEDLAQRAQNQLLEKVKQVRIAKQGRMVILPTYVTIVGMLINLIMVMSAMMNQMSSALG